MLQSSAYRTKRCLRRSNSRSSSSSTRFDSTGESTPLTQKVIFLRRGSTIVLRRPRRDRDAMTDGDGVVSDQDFFDNEAHDSLTFRDAKRFSCAAQAGKKCGERF